MTCLASGNFINYSFISLFVDSFSGLTYSLNRWIDNKFVNSLRGFKYSQFDRGFFNFDYLVSLFKYSLNNRLNDSFLNDNFVSSFVGVLICSLDKQFDIRLLEFFGFQRLTIDSIVDFGDDFWILQRFRTFF